MMLDPPTIADTPVQASEPIPAAATPRSRICPECSQPFERPAKGPGGHKRFCSAKCRTDWGNREKAEGSTIITLAKIWRLNRGAGEVGKLAFARLTEALDVLNDSDGRAGRHKLNANGPLAPYIKDVIAEPYLDRRRNR
jgi:hypothetical protein